MAPVLEFENITKEYRGFWLPWVSAEREPLSSSKARGRSSEALRSPGIKNSFRALQDFSLAIEPGEIFGFLGPNGAGKTTAIHIALGLMAATSGQGRMLGRPFGHARSRRRVGFLPENIAFYHRPAARLIRIHGLLNGVRDPRLAQRSKELLDVLDLRDVAEKPVQKFSRGMLQRVGLAQALVNDPDLLILDEPTSALDTAGRVAVRELLLRAKAQGKTIFLSSHLLSEVELVCDRIGILHRGRLLREGTVASLLESRSEYEITARHADTETITRVPSSEQRAAIQMIWNAGGEVVSVSPVRRSLEDLFLELTDEAHPEGKLP